MEEEEEEEEEAVKPEKEDVDVVGDFYADMNILIIDPGWSNLGMILLQFSYSRKELRKYSFLINLFPDGVKSKLGQYSAFDYTNAIDQQLSFFAVPPYSINTIDYLIMENQPKNFKPNIILATCICCYFTYLYDVLKFDNITPMKVKNHLGVQRQGDHSKNKILMVERIRKPDIIFYGFYDHNIADCIGLFNVFVVKHKRIEKMCKEYKLVNFP